MGPVLVCSRIDFHCGLDREQSRTICILKCLIPIVDLPLIKLFFELKYLQVFMINRNSLHYLSISSASINKRSTFNMTFHSAWIITIEGFDININVLPHLEEHSKAVSIWKLNSHQFLSFHSFARYFNKSFLMISTEKLFKAESANQFIISFPGFSFFLLFSDVFFLTRKFSSAIMK